MGLIPLPSPAAPLRDAAFPMGFRLIVTAALPKKTLTGRPGEGQEARAAGDESMQTLPVRLRVLLVLLLSVLTFGVGIVGREPVKRGVAWLETTLENPTAGAHLYVGSYYEFPSGRAPAWPTFRVPRRQFTVRERAILDRYERYHYVVRDFLPERYYHLYLRVTDEFTLNVPHRDWPVPVMDFYYTAH